MRAIFVSYADGSGDSLFRTSRLKWVVLFSFPLLFVALLAIMSQTSVINAQTNVDAAVCDVVQDSIQKAECEALVKLYIDTDGDNWKDNSGWPGSDSPQNYPCTNTYTNTNPVWYGISCQNDLVYSIVLTSNNLSGELTAVPWSNFEHLVGLRLGDNKITGTIPSVLAEMVDLNDLALNNNSLSGPIPEFGASCGQACALKHLWLQQQSPGLTGGLPASLGNLNGLLLLNVAHNKLDGPLPVEMLDMTALVHFEATDNHFTGPILDFSKLAGLRRLALERNRFDGDIPPTLGDINNKVHWLKLANNQLEGPLPSNIACLEDDVTYPMTLTVTLAGNMLYMLDEMAEGCLDNSKISLGHQTLPPANLKIEDVGEETVDLVWSPISPTIRQGYYEVGYTTTPEFESGLTVREVGSQLNDSAVINGLDPDTQYYFYIRTQTPAMTSENSFQKNDLTSDWSPTPVEVKTLKPLSPTKPILSVYKELAPTSVSVGEKIVVTVTMLAEGGNASPVVLTDTLPSTAADPAIISGEGAITNTHLSFNGALTDGVATVIRYEYTLADPVEPGAILYTEAVMKFDNETYVSGAAIAVEGALAVETLVALYVSGDNNLGEEHMRDMFEKVERAQIPDDVAVLLLYDGPGEEDAYYYRIHDNDGNESTVGCGDKGEPFCGYELNRTMWKWRETVGTKSSLQEFLIGALTAYDPERVIVSLIGHGSGWSPDLLLPQPSTHDEKPDNRSFGGLLFDQNPERALSTRQLGAALQQVTDRSGHKVDLLYLDACLMAMSEVAYEVRDSVKYLLASESTSWTSFRYDLHLQADVLSDPGATEELAIQWIENEEMELHPDYGLGYPYTYSVLDLSRMEQLLKDEDKLADWLIRGMDGPNGDDHREHVRRAFEEADCFDSSQDQVIDGQDYFCDLRSFATKLRDRYGGTSAETSLEATANITETKIFAAADELQKFLIVGDDTIVRHHTHHSFQHPNSNEYWGWSDEISGISIYLPVGEEDDWKRAFYKPAYLQSVAHGKWDEFLNAYWDYADPPEEPEPCQGHACLPRGQGVVRTETSVTSVYLPLIVKE